MTDREAESQRFKEMAAFARERKGKATADDRELLAKWRREDERHDRALALAIEIDRAKPAAEFDRQTMRNRCLAKAAAGFFLLGPLGLLFGFHGYKRGDR